MNKYTCCRFVFLLILVWGFKAQGAQPLIQITKEVVNIGTVMSDEVRFERTGRCQIQSDGQVRYQLYQGPYEARRDQVKKIPSSDFALLVQTLQVLKEQDQPQNYLFEYDFTGDYMHPTGQKDVKNDEAVAYVDSKEIHFYWMRRRLLRTYKGPQASVLRELLRKYCLMSI